MPTVHLKLSTTTKPTGEDLLCLPTFVSSPITPTDITHTHSQVYPVD